MYALCPMANLMNIGSCEVSKMSSGFENRKKPGCVEFVRAPHFASTGLIAPKISQTLSPLDLYTCTEFGPDSLRFVGVIPDRLICRTPHKSLQYRLKPCCAAFSLNVHMQL